MRHAVLKVAMGQMLVEGGRPADNLQRAVEMISDAGAQDCDIMILPECLDLGWTHPSAPELAEEIPGPRSDQLRQAATDQRIYVVAGLTERDGEAVYNTAVLISPSGEILSKHRKINVLTIAQSIYEVGDRLTVARTPLGVLAINICADNFPSSLVLGHAQARMGAQIILSPCAWVVPGDHDNSKTPYGEMWKQSFGTLASLYEIPVVGVSNVGRIEAGVWAGRKCIGCSLAVDADGKIAVEGPYGEMAECMLVTELEIHPRSVKGTAVAEMLRAKGYEGP